MLGQLAGQPRKILLLQCKPFLRLGRRWMASIHANKCRSNSVSLAHRTGPLALRALISISNTRRLCPDHHRRAFIERFRSCNNSTLIALS